MSLWSKTDTNLSKPKFLDRGQIVGFQVTAGGTGYGTGTSTVVISAPTSGTRATANVVAVDGAVTGLTITNPGAGYTSEDTITTTFGDTGAIVGFTITDGGTGHSAATSIATIAAPASGTQATATVVADEDGVITGLTIVNPGAGYAAVDGSPVVTITDRGHIIGFTINDGGTGHTASSIATISAPTTGTQATATIVQVGGVITDLVITNPGSGYTAEDTITVTISVAGSGADIEAIYSRGSGSDITANYNVTGANAALTPIYHGAPYDDGHIYFVDNAEAQVTANRARGINAPGWWLYKTKTVAGVVRPIAHHLVALSATAANAGDASDDSVLADS